MKEVLVSHLLISFWFCLCNADDIVCPELASTAIFLSPVIKVAYYSIPRKILSIKIQNYNYYVNNSFLSSDERLHFGTILCFLGIRYKSYCSNVCRTMFVQPTQV